jgi:tRNA threonylcarbamoyladenosine biosynthesis protein TsaB
MPEQARLLLDTSGEPVVADETLILATDTSTRHCTVAVCRFSVGGECEVAAQTSVDQKRLHAERLMDSMQATLDACEHTLEEITCLAVSIGPGSFTGLRVGSATWKGLAYALGLPLVAVPTLDAMSLLNAVADGIVIPMIDARMDEVFGAVYRFKAGVREKLTPDRVCTVEKLLAADYACEYPLIVLGDGAQRYRERIQALAPRAFFAAVPCGMPRADAVAREGYALLCAGVHTDAAQVAPQYLRVSQAEQARADRLAMAESEVGIS